MNKIIVNNGNIINDDNDYLEVRDNKIIFKKSGSYTIDYINTDNVKVTFYLNSDIVVNLFEVSIDNNICINNNYIIDSGYLKVNKFYSNKSCNEEINIDLNSSNSKVDYNFSSICLLQEKYIFNVNHNSLKTISNISNRCVTLDNSYISFVINSNVLEDKYESILNQNTKIITFGDSDVKICPNMFISCDDIIAKHGSVVGTVDEDIIFYMMSRGIDYNTAVKLYIRGLIFTNLNCDFDIRSRIYKIIDMYWR